MTRYLFIVSVLITLFAGSIFSQTTENNSLSSVLNTDGTLKENINGSFDASGFEMRLEPSGEPVFQTSNSPDRTTSYGWSSLGSTVGIEGPDEAKINCVMVDGANIYVGGYFAVAGNIKATNIAMWNGTDWLALGSGVSGGTSPVNSLYYDDIYLYAGGSFTVAGGQSIAYLAKWDGTSWSGLGTGVNSIVQTICKSGSDLYAGGSFSQAGGSPASRIAKWDGSSWTALGSGVESTVTSIVADVSYVYASGNFTTAGGSPASKIARWEKASSTWAPIGSGLSLAAQDMKLHENKLYVVGVFSVAGGSSANGIAVWDGSVWSSLGLGVQGIPYSLQIFGDNIYVGGSITQAGAVAANNIAKYTFSTGAWSALGDGAETTVYALAVHEKTGSMVVGGGFTFVSGNTASRRIAKFTDSDNPLPVELVSFSGRLAGNSIQLNWQTATEVDNNGFEVERKTQNSDWSKIGFIEGHGMCNSPKYYSFSDNTITSGGKYSYRLKQIDGDGTFSYSNTIEISTSVITDFILEQNYPNPFSSENPETDIRFALPVSGEIRLEVFSPLGERISTLAEGFREAGVYSVGFNAQNLSAGVYFYTLTHAGKSITRKLILTE